MESEVSSLKMNRVLLPPETWDQSEGRMPTGRDISLGFLRSIAVVIMITWQSKLGHKRTFLRRNGMLFLEHV